MVKNLSLSLILTLLTTSVNYFYFSYKPSAINEVHYVSTSIPPISALHTESSQSTPATSCTQLHAVQLARWVDEAAARARIQSGLLMSVLFHESHFDVGAVSPKGAVGLMQLMPPILHEYQVSEPLNPRANINAGAQLLKRLLRKYHGDVRLALAAYNAGPGRVDANKGVPAIKETQNFVGSITNENRTLDSARSTVAPEDQE